MTEWEIKGREFINCNCAYGCPCQFMARPTQGNCAAVAMFAIDAGRHGDIRLDGLAFGLIAAWPGAIHEGHGEVVPLVDERASALQRGALLRIMSGEDTDPGATLFQVFSATFDTVHEPVFTPIDFTVDVAGRTANVSVPGWVRAHGEPIANPVTGSSHRARINLPQGFEYDTCEVGRGFAETHGPVALSLADSHGQFASLHLTGHGVANHA